VGTDDRCFNLRSERTGGDNGRTYTIVYSATDASGNVALDTVEVHVPHDQRQVPVAFTETPRRFALHPAQPNPFHASTTLRFDVPPSGGKVKLEVFDVRGRRVTALEERWLPGGTHAARWDGADAAGVAVAP